MSVNAEQVSLRHIRDVEDGVLRRFICGRQQLDDFLHEDARDYDAHGLTRTVLVFLEGKRGKATAGSKKQRNCSYVQGPVSVITPSDQRQGLMVACPKVNWGQILICLSNQAAFGRFSFCIRTGFAFHLAQSGKKHVKIAKRVWMENEKLA